MTFHISTAQRVSCIGQHNRIDNLMARKLRGNKCPVLRQFLIDEFHFSAVFKYFNPFFVWHLFSGANHNTQFGVAFLHCFRNGMSRCQDFCESYARAATGCSGPQAGSFSRMALAYGIAAMPTLISAGIGLPQSYLPLSIQPRKTLRPSPSIRLPGSIARQHPTSPRSHSLRPSLLPQ